MSGVYDAALLIIMCFISTTHKKKRRPPDCISRLTAFFIFNFFHQRTHISAGSFFGCGKSIQNLLGLKTGRDIVARLVVDRQVIVT